VLEVDEVLSAAERLVDKPFLERSVAMSGHGISVDRQSLTTEVDGVFAAGECVIGASVAVRAMAQGRQAAVAVGQYLKGEAVKGEVKRLNVRMGKLTEDEVDVLRREAKGKVRLEVVSSESGSAEAKRCLECSCGAREDCRLRALADEYGARPSRFGGAQRSFARDTSLPGVVYEPGKCILCGRCVRISREAGEPLGLAFLERGFGTSVGVPFDGTLSEGLQSTAERVVRACPTGALDFAKAP